MCEVGGKTPLMSFLLWSKVKSVVLSPFPPILWNQPLILSFTHADLALCRVLYFMLFISIPITHTFEFGNKVVELKKKEMTVGEL